MLNINYGHNKDLMEKCRVLKDYAMFVDISRKYMKQERRNRYGRTLPLIYVGIYV